MRRFEILKHDSNQWFVEMFFMYLEGCTKIIPHPLINLKKWNYGQTRLTITILTLPLVRRNKLPVEDINGVRRSGWDRTS